MVAGDTVKLVASLITRDELPRYLEIAVGSMLEWADEIRVLDDGSTDGWRDVLTDKRIKVLNWDREGDDSFTNHAAARSRLREWTLESDATWVAAVDADEVISDGAALRAACQAATTGALTTVMTEVWEASVECLCTREDGGWHRRPVANLWRPDAVAKQRLTLADKGTATGRVPDQVHRLGSRPSGVSTLHLGWTCESERAERFKRYTKPGEGHASAHVQSIMWGCDRVKLERLDWPAGLEAWKPAILERTGR